jgi:Na+:H+ antiporter, NhaA family
VLAVINSHLPSALRTFLLTLAVVDDLLGIVVIAVFYSSGLNLWWAALAFVLVALGWWLMRRGWMWPMVLIVPAVWWLVFISGIHATIAGVLLGLSVPLSRTKRVEAIVRPISAGFCVPVFAFFVAGVAIGGASAFSNPIVWAIVAGLVLGKPIGIWGSTMLLATFTKADLSPDVRWIDVLGVAMLAGIGFTVSLLIGSLAFPVAEFDDAKIAILLGSLLSAVLAAFVLVARNRAHKLVYEAEQRDDDHDGVPDVFQ